MKSIHFKLLSLLAISCLGILVYSNTFFCSFHFDDKIYIINNPAIKNIRDLANIWEFCPCRFMTFLSIALNYHFYHLNVLAYHLFNIAVHLGSAFLVWWLTLLTLRTPAMKENKISRHTDLIALLVGLIFVSHPIQTEAVTYIWQRAASMAAFFYLASLCFYIRSRLRSTSGFYYTCSLITAVLAMFTKENTITLPLMILLYEFSFFETKKNFPWKRIFPFLFCLLIIPITMLLTNSARFQEIHDVTTGPDGISPLHYFLTQVRVMVTYIRLAFLPVHLNLDYDYPVFKSFFEIPVSTSFLFLIAILFSAQRMFSQYRLISFSIFWFFLTLLPESSFLPQRDVILEHRLYLPSVGYSIFLVSGIYYLLQKNSVKTMVAVLMMIIACYSVMTYQRNKVWKNEFTLWNDTIQRSHKARPYNNLGLEYYQRNDLAQAMSDYNKAIETDPNYENAYYNRGLVYYKQGNLTQAVSDYSKAIELYPGYADAYYNRGVIYDKQSHFTQAMSDFDKAIELNPDNAEAYSNRGIAYAKQNNFSQAISDLTRAIAINPNYAEAYNNRGLTYHTQHNLTQALSDLNRAIEIDPEYADAYINRGTVYGEQNNLAQAVSDYSQAIEINPRNAPVYSNRAIVYYRLKEYDHAWADVHELEELGVTVNPELLKALKQTYGQQP